MRIIVRTMMDEKSDILRSLMLQPPAVTVPAIDAWAGLVAAERNGERAAKEKVSQLKEIMAKSVEEYKGMIASGSSIHQIAESVGIKERSQSQNLPPFKTRVPHAALVCSSAEMTLSMDVQNGHLKVVTDDGHMVTGANVGPSVAVIDRCFDGIHPYLTLSAIANGVDGFHHVLYFITMLFWYRVEAYFIWTTIHADASTRERLVGYLGYSTSTTKRYCNR